MRRVDSPGTILITVKFSRVLWGSPNFLTIPPDGRILKLRIAVSSAVTLSFELIDHIFRLQRLMKGERVIKDERIGLQGI